MKANIDNSKLKAFKAGFAQVAKELNIDLQYHADTYLAATQAEKPYLTAHKAIAVRAIQGNTDLQDLGESESLYIKMTFLSFSSQYKALAESD